MNAGGNDLGDGAGKWSSAFATASTGGMQTYEDVLVGPVFLPWGELLLDRLELSSGEHLLDVATGPGTVARIASSRLGPDGYVLATDLSDAMLEIAIAKGGVPGGARVEYRNSPAEPLDAPASAFDVACCQHGLQFFPDRGGALSEMHRALRSGGRLGLAVWAGIELCPPMASVRNAVRDVMGADAAKRYADGPWGLHDPGLLAELVTDTGFSDVSVEEVQRTVTFEDGARRLDRSLAASGLAPEVSGLPGAERAALRRAIADNLSAVTDPSGAVVSYMTSQIVLATA
jgi:SAM-dependent methyltransferase